MLQQVGNWMPPQEQVCQVVSAHPEAGWALALGWQAARMGATIRAGPSARGKWGCVGLNWEAGGAMVEEGCESRGWEVPWCSAPSEKSETKLRGLRGVL